MHLALGLNYLSTSSVESFAPVSESSAAPSVGENKLSAWKHPGFQPELVFLNYDQDDEVLDEEQRLLFENILKAMNLQPNQVWKIEAGNFHFGNILNRLRSLNIQSPIVVLKKEPEIFNNLQQIGVHMWAECFSISSMVAKPQLKKATWKVLQYFLKERVQK